jgi:hypothetical protein
VTDLLKQLVTDHGLAAVLGLVSVVMQLRIAAKLFDALSDQNRSMARLLERNGMDTDPPPTTKPRKIWPRAVTPLPWKADEGAVPEPVEPERSTPPPRRRHRGI